MMKTNHAIPILLAAALSTGALAQDNPIGEEDERRPNFEPLESEEPDINTDGGRSDSYEPNVIPTDEPQNPADESVAADEGADPRRGEDHPLAQGSEHAVDGKPREFTEVDKDGDGLLSIEEAREALPERLEITDANGDGLLNRDEAVSVLPEVSFAGGSPNEPVGSNDYQVIRDRLSEESPAASQSEGAAPADPETPREDAGGEADPIESDDDAI